MADDHDDDVIIDDDASVVRWIPAAVVMTVLAGFFTLAWYAYHTGTQSVNEEDLMVVEADKTPMKEKPLDPGGMKFPNQDKTIYDTFANGSQTPPKVERVVPAPEEPIEKPAESAETKTWINEKLKEEAPAAGAVKQEQVLGTADATKQMVPLADAKPVATEKPVQPPAVDKAAPSDEVGIVTHVAKHKEAPVNVKDVKIVSSKDKEKEAKKAEAKKPVEKAKPATSGSVKVQLGAYASEDEAKNAWGKIQKKFPELSNKTVYVVKADLGEKGIYYRLRAGVADADEAKTLCATLSAKGQACMLASK